MEKSRKNEEGMSKQNKAIIGATVAALAAAAAGAIFLYGTESGKKARREVRSWMLKMKADVLDEMERMKEWSEEAYDAIVDSVAKKYETMKDIDPLEIAALARDLKNHWKVIQKKVNSPSKTRKPRASKKKSE